MRRWLIAVSFLAACGEGDQAREPGRITVSTGARGFSASSSRFIFHRANGAVLETRELPRVGSVEGPMESGGMVTLVAGRSNGSLAFVYTIFGLEVGDDLSIRMGIAFPEHLASASVQLPGPVAGASRYVLESECAVEEVSDPQMLAHLNAQLDCAVGDTMDVYAFAVDATGTRLAYTVARSVPLEGSIMLDAWRTDLSVHSVHFRNAPANADVLVAQGTLNRGIVRGYAEGTSSGGAAVDFRQAPIGDGLCIWLNPREGEERTAPARTAMFADPERSPIFTLDFALDLLPPVESASLEGEEERRLLSWSTAGPTDSIDSFTARVELENASWFIEGDPEVSSFRFPALPDLAGVVEAPGRPVRAWIQLSDDDAFADWAARKKIGDLPSARSCGELNVSNRVEPTRIRVTAKETE